MKVMETGSTIKWNKVQRIQRNIIAAVYVYCFQETKGHPSPQEDDMIAKDHDANKKARAEDDCFCWVSIFSLHTKWSRKFMMDFVNIFVDSLMVQESVKKVVPCVLNNSTTQALHCNYLPSWHLLPIIGNVEELSEVVGTTDQRQLDAEMVEQQHFEAPPLFLKAFWSVLLYLILLHGRNKLKNKTRQTK